MNNHQVKVNCTKKVRNLPGNFNDLIELFYEKISEIITEPLCSGFRTFALIESRSGNIYTGSNVEGWNFLNSWCAERDAIAELSRQENELIKNIIIGSKNNDFLLTPGGPCREMIRDFAYEDTLIIMPSESEILVSTAGEMYPYPSPYRVKAMPFCGSKDNNNLREAAENLPRKSKNSLQAIKETFKEYSNMIDLAGELLNEAITPYYGLKCATIIQCEHGNVQGVSIESLEYCSSISSCKMAVSNALMLRSGLGKMLRMVTLDQFNNVLAPIGETRQLMVDDNEQIYKYVGDVKILVQDYEKTYEIREVAIRELMPYPAKIL